jgi:hypothetical protein
MPFDGNGTFIRSYNWQTDAAAGIDITASRMDGEDDGFATGLSSVITRDGQSEAQADLPMGGFKHTSVADGAFRDEYTAIGQSQDGGLTYAGTVGGTSDVITITLTPAISAYAAGQKFSFIAGGNNTTNVTLNVNSKGAKSVTKNGTTALAAGDIISGAIVLVEYDGTQFQLISGGSTLTSAGVSALYLAKANNLSELASAATARTNLGLGAAATQALTAFLQPSNNLSDLAALATALTNLGFLSSASSNGYIAIPYNATNKIYIQWFTTASLSTGSTAGVSFPTAFPNNCWGVYPTPTNTASNGPAVVSAKTTASFTMQNNTGNGQTFLVLAIGN